MLTFFHGWRRKIGVATLLVACVFMGGWARSLSVIDFFTIPIGRTHLLYFTSMNGGFWLDWGFRYAHISEGPLWDSGRLSDTPKVEKMAGGSDQLEELLRATTYPYWSIVIPLTLLSACLLLIKPRPKPNQAVSHA